MSWTAPKIRALLLRVPAPKVAKMPMPKGGAMYMSARNVANSTKTSGYGR